MPPKKKTEQKQQDLISATTLKSNCGTLGFFRTFVAIVVGIAAGILGVQGWLGLLPHFATQILCSCAMFLKGVTTPKDYFGSWSTLLFFNVFSSLTLLTYILCWMIFFNVCHIFV